MAQTSDKTREVGSVMLFDKWGFEGVEVSDRGLRGHINLDPLLLPHSGGRQEHRRFGKSQVNIVERLINNMMRHGRCGGKKQKATNIVRNALEIIQLRMGRNPINVLVRAVENTAPCEDVTRVSYGGRVSHISVDVAPQRRVDIALRLIAEGARRTAFGNPKTIEECLAEELIYAAERDSKSYAVQKRDELERVALSSR